MRCGVISAVSHIQTDIVAGVGLITLDRPEALNALIPADGARPSQHRAL